MKDMDSGVIYSDMVTKREIRDKNDRRVIGSAVKEIEKYDRIVTWYGTKFDLPFVRSKSMKYGIEFPAYKDLYHTDLYYMCRSKMRLHSNRLQSFCEYLGIPAKEHRMTPELNEKCQAGDEEALGVILLHCEEDVNSTGEAFNRLLRHMMLQKRSV